MEGNVGALWLWDDSSAQLLDAALAGGPSHVVLADGSSKVNAQVW
jgi:hypothetical protein